MSIRKKFIQYLFTAFYCLGAQLALGATYWPVGDGLVWTYRGSGSDYSIEMVGYEANFYQLYDWGSGYVGIEFQENADGDIEVVSSSYYSQGAIDPDFYDYNPPMLYLDFPLEVGKTWASVSSAHGIIGEVLREETVTVPAGTFDVIVVRLINLFPQDWIFAGELYLAPGVGQVLHEGHGLVSFDGPVGIQESSWGSVKALFR